MGTNGNPLTTPTPTAEPTPAVTPSPTPAVTPSPTPEKKLEPTPTPTAEPTPAVTPSPTPQPSANPTPEPTPTVTPGRTQPPKEEQTQNPQVTPSPTPHPEDKSTPAPTPSADDDSEDDSDGQYELLVPIGLNEKVETISSYYGAGYEDFVDAMVQIKEVKSSFDESVWSGEIVKDAINTAGKGSIQDIIGKYSETETSQREFDLFLDELSEDIFNRYMTFGDYALNLEATIAIVENLLKENMTEEDFNALMEKIKDDDSIQSLEDFYENAALEEFLGHLEIGASTRTAGLALKSNKTLMNAAASVKERVAAIAAAIKEHVFHKSATATSAIVGKSKITSSLAFAALYFGYSLYQDIKNDRVTVEREVINAARAGVIAIAGYAGTAVTAALNGTTVGSFAGPIGAAVGLIVSLIGHHIIDYIEYNFIQHTFNGVPRPDYYEEITVADVRRSLNSQGYQIGAQRMGDATVYDVINALSAQTDNEDFLNYMLQNTFGLELLSPEKLEKYDRVAQVLVNASTVSWDDLQEFLPNLDAEEKAFVESYRTIINSSNDRIDSAAQYDLNFSVGHGVYSRIEPRYDIPPWRYTKTQLEEFKNNPQPVPGPPPGNMWGN